MNDASYKEALQSGCIRNVQFLIIEGLKIEESDVRFAEMETVPYERGNFESDEHWRIGRHLTAYNILKKAKERQDQLLRSEH